MDGAHFAQSIHKCSELSSPKRSALIFKFMHVHVLHVRRDSSLSVKQFYNELEQILAKLSDELKMKSVDPSLRMAFRYSSTMKFKCLAQSYLLFSSEEGQHNCATISLHEEPKRIKLYRRTCNLFEPKQVNKNTFEKIDFNRE